MRWGPVARRWALALILAPVIARADAFERISPEDAGYSSEKLQGLKAFLQASGSDSLLLLHDGKVFFEWGDIHRKLLVHSIRKALLSGLYGHLALSRDLDLSQTLDQLGVDDEPLRLSPAEKLATVQDVLQSRSGVYHPSAAESEGMSQRRPERGSHPAGTFFYYNNWDFNVAGAVFEQWAGRRLYDVFNEAIAQPLGMLDYHHRIGALEGPADVPTAEDDGFYQFERSQSRFPAYHFRLSAHDLALYGQLMLAEGAWKGRQLVSADWIRRSTQPRSVVQAEYGLAYGMLWDVVVPARAGEKPAFFHTGVDVHLLAVYPERKLVMVHRVNTDGPYKFNEGDLYQVIRQVHGARGP
ncbi:serine hydrolase [Ideonella sp. DXS29W]|uniref:Serine hydrolase n=1 Tax=Ideonella lacteola TaxID=2984193 RepID=A0ABU9BN18_9BURK